MRTIGKKVWTIPEGYIPPSSSGDPEMISHETICILNTGKQKAQVEITLFFTDKDPVGPYQVTVEAQRVNHVRINDLEDPEPVPKGIEYASVVESDVPVVVQHSRLDTTQAENALFTAIAFPA